MPDPRTEYVNYDFNGGLIVSCQGVRFGLFAAVDLGLVTKEEAQEIAGLIKEATQAVLRGMKDD